MNAAAAAAADVPMLNLAMMEVVIMPPTLIGGGIKQCFCLSSV